LKAEGFCTPKEDKAPQKMCVPGRRVIPIIFIPGIMGSNLRLTKGAQDKLKKSNNVAWNPDKLGEMYKFKDYTSAQRQQQLDQYGTEVDIYEPTRNPTGDVGESADQRHGAVKLSSPIQGSKSKEVLHDPETSARRDSTARHRGWGEVYFGSYKDLLEACELCFNDLNTAYWEKVLNVDPRQWDAHPSFSLQAITRAERDNALKGCVFPVHALGYNWLQMNMQSALMIRNRIDQLIARYRGYGYDCRKVVLVTHSMGGLVVRALVHPSIGGYEEKILGVVHGVMPAAGAPAAYKRIRSGVEGEGITPNILGKTGPKVSAVLANSAGGLELLPSAKYGNGWLQIKQGNNIVKSLPARGDPYEEIYKLRGQWYGLLVEEWLNPARDPNGGVERTIGLLANAKHFHELIANTFHPNSYAHYGIDPKRPSWETITWNVTAGSSNVDIGHWRINEDRGNGKIKFTTGEKKYGWPIGASAELEDATGPGDQTVPVRSSSTQLQSGVFRGVFEQRGYEHQKSYSDENALSSTIYCITRIIQSMDWN
jgi:hypothetical protein